MNVEFTGVLLEAAVVRTKPADHGHGVPVLCLDLGEVGPGAHVVHCERAYTEATRHTAERTAAALIKGTRVRISTDIQDMRISLPRVLGVQPIPSITTNAATAAQKDLL